MLLNGTQLIGSPILSLQTGTELAKTSVAVINPHNLSILAYVVEGQNVDENPSLLRIADVRELSDIGMIIDSNDEFVIPDDVIKLKEIYDLQFDIIDKTVLDEKRNKVGKVFDYTVDAESFVIQQLNVKKPLLKSFNDPELIIHRSQITEITDEAIVIKSGNVTMKASQVPSRNFVNPFRQSNPQAEASSRKQAD